LLELFADRTSVRFQCKMRPEPGLVWFR